MTRYPHQKENSIADSRLAKSAPPRSPFATLDIYVVVGLAAAILGGLLFAWLAERVSAGGTLGFDDAVLTWMGAHQVALLQRSVLEITALGEGSVVIALTLVAALILAVDRHRLAAFLLIIAAYGGLVLNAALKHIFHRPRPHIFTWGATVASSSFPSGHAMNAAVLYLTIALVLTRLEPRWWARLLTLIVAVLLIALICLSRLYLGVHYPTDVIGGLIIGIAWVGVCVSGLEVLQSRVASRESRANGSRGEI
jgi:undecaprenyl-diphosphatase